LREAVRLAPAQARARPPRGAQHPRPCPRDRGPVGSGRGRLHRGAPPLARLRPRAR
jgi:hypothetical protein